MLTMHDTAEDDRLARLLLALAPRLNMPKAELVAEIEAQMSVLLGVEVHEAFRAVAARAATRCTSFEPRPRTQVGTRARRPRAGRGGTPSRQGLDERNMNDTPNHHPRV